MFDRIKKLFKSKKKEIEDTAVSPPSLPDTRVLYQQLNTHFSIDEIQTLCLELRIDYEQLRGDTKSSKVRELLIFCQRRRRLPELVSYMQEHRPHLEAAPQEESPSISKKPVSKVSEQPYNAQEVRQNANRLMKLMRTHFNLNDIEAICLELHIPYDNIKGDSLDAKSRELVNYMVRRWNISHLVEVCQQKRPDVNWTTDEAKPSEPVHDVAAIQQLLQRVFADDEAMIGFCQIHFPDLLVEFGSGMSFQAKMNRLLEYCRRRQAYDTLLHELEAAYADDFAQYAPYTEGS